MLLSDRLPSLATKLLAEAPRLAQMPMVAGFDGFVDEMISAVETRQGLDRFDPVADISRFAHHIAAAAGRSSLREIVVRSTDPGGCTVNLGDGLCGLGVPLDVFATLGEPIHPAFAPFAARCHRVSSWGREPGRTLAFEFADGKLMFSAVSQLADFNPAHLERCLADGAFLAACQRARVIAFTNWTLYPHQTANWRLLLDRVLSRLTHRPVLFVDLVDPSARTAQDVLGMLDLLRECSAHCEVVLGVNLNEANVLSRTLGLLECRHEDGPEVAEQAARLRARIGIDVVATHCVRLAALADQSGPVWTPGPFCSAPKKSVGAGDRFNAGYCAAHALGWSAQDRLLLGGATSGFFVRNAHSGSPAQIHDLMLAWSEGAV